MPSQRFILLVRLSVRKIRGLVTICLSSVWWKQSWRSLSLSMTLWRYAPPLQTLPCRGARGPRGPKQAARKYFLHCKTLLYFSCLCRVPTHPWKYLNFFVLNSRPWKYLKTWQVLESPWISFYRSLKVIEFTKSNCAISATSLNNISVWLKCILIHLTWSSYNSTQYSLLTYKISQPTENCKFCYYQLKLYRNHTNRY